MLLRYVFGFEKCSFPKGLISNLMIKMSCKGFLFLENAGQAQFAGTQ